MPLTPFRLERYFARYEFSTRYLLCSSDCQAMSVAELLELEPGSEEQLKATWLGYTESQGAPALRSDIARMYERITAEDVLVFSGGQEAIYWFMHAVLAPGDHVIVHTPGYQSHTEVASAIGAQVTEWRAREENAWAPDLDELRRAITPATRAIVINTPHNPTGWLMPRSMHDELYRIADRHGLIVLADEVYRELEHDPDQRLPAGCDASELAVSLSVTSKAYGLAGLRIGWLATRNAALRKRLAMLKDYSTICNSAPSEMLAGIALRHRMTLVQRNLAFIRRNLDLLDAFFAAYADRFTWRRPIAGPIAFPKYLGGDVEAFCDDLVRGAGVLLLPGTVYGDAGQHFRIGFGRANLPEALLALRAHLG